MEVVVVLEDGDVGVVVCIEDLGMGILDFVLGWVFEWFYLLLWLGSGVKSMGLGLSLVWEIVYLYDGEVVVGNWVEGGVWVELRLKGWG